MTSAVMADAALAATLFAIDPVGLGGVVVRSGPGPARDRWMAHACALLAQGGPVGRIPLGIGDERLLGGLDLPASLAAGRPVVECGVLAANDGGAVILAMAERIQEGVAARIANVLDVGEIAIERDGLSARLDARVGMILLDEGLQPDERPPALLLDRLAFHLDLAGVGARDAFGPGPEETAVKAARRTLEGLKAVPDRIVEAICAAASAFGLGSIRPPLLAVRAARAHAALQGRRQVSEEDAVVAARLVLAPRATSLPADPSQDTPDSDTTAPLDGGEAEAFSLQDVPPRPGESDRPDRETSESSQAERVVAAVQAALPDGLLDRVVQANLRSARAPRASGSGTAAKSARRGRPSGSRPGALRSGDRLNLPETLRAAAPWQKLRSAGQPDGPIRVRAEDFRIRRFVQRRESTTIFLVDASGSAAFQRLAEAKGAVELLLAKAYVSRARVALIAFRGAQAEILLPPTHSLARAKRSLADLAGGGGTPLACGLDAGLALATLERAKDRTPLLVVLTDGRANIGRDGSPGRAGAERDALAAAARVRQAGVGAAFIDTSPRAQSDADRFARAMGGAYAFLPYADAGAVSGLVNSLHDRRDAR